MKLSVSIEFHDERWKRLGYIKILIRKIIGQTLRYLNPNAGSIFLSVHLADDEMLTELNIRHRARDYAANILSFPAQDPHLINLSNTAEKHCVNIGDIFISFDRLKAEATEANVSLREHLHYLIIHSMLHLIGFRHETEQAVEDMTNMEIKILRHFGYESPHE